MKTTGLFIARGVTILLVGALLQAQLIDTAKASQLVRLVP